MLRIKPLLELPKICAYCGSPDNLTDEHVIPRSLKPKGDAGHEWMHVYACANCNGVKSALDEQCRNLLTLHQANTASSGAAALRDDKVIRSVKRLQNEGRHSPTRQLVEQLVAQEGYIDGEGNHVSGVVQENLPFHDWLELLVKGVAMNLYSQRFQAFESQYRVQSRADFVGLVTVPVCVENRLELGSHTRIIHVGISEGDPMGLYAFQFYGGMGFSVFAAPKEILPDLLLAFQVPPSVKSKRRDVIHVTEDSVHRKPKSGNEDV